MTTLCGVCHAEITRKATVELRGKLQVEQWKPFNPDGSPHLCCGNDPKGRHVIREGSDVCLCGMTASADVRSEAQKRVEDPR